MENSDPSHTLFTQSVASKVDLLTLCESKPGRYPFLLESSEGDTGISRYDFLFYSSDEYLELDSENGIGGSCSTLDTSKSFIENLNLWTSSNYSSDPDNFMPFIGGWFLYLGYELAKEVEPSLDLPEAPGHLPIALAVRCPAAIIYDKVTQTSQLVAETKVLLDAMLEDIDDIHPQDSEVRNNFEITDLTEGDTEGFISAVHKIKQYILDGDVFQVNLSRPWSGKVAAEISNASIYRQLRNANPAPFSGMMCWQNSTVFSSSPERLVEVRGKQIQTRPIAGTRERTQSQEADEGERNALVTHPKERAEHIMLIDLERNDLGRICTPGTVDVNELMVLESYTHVHHIVSNVRGELRNNIAAGDVIRAVFPGGTITGCPKVRCMEIIAELEGEGRSYYTGAMGYLDHRGNMDLNILIRCLERDGETVRFRTGAGIVADSIPENELLETRHKARGLLSALNAA